MELFLAYELKEIVAEGYKILMLEVEEFQVGEKQIIYTKESITSSKLINDLFK